MTGPLIINARHRLAWHHRLFSDASTAMIWGGWLWLWAPVLRSWAFVGVGSHPAVVKLMERGSVEAIQRAVFALVVASGALLIWSRLVARKARTGVALSVCDYARHFELPEHEIHAGRRASVCVVRHDDSGRIVRLECRESTPDRRQLEVMELASIGAARYPAPVAISS